MAMMRIYGLMLLMQCVTAHTFGGDHDPLDYLMHQDITFGRGFDYTRHTNRAEVIRVNIDLSLDAGATWHRRIAHGIPCKFGTQTYKWSYRHTPELWTEHARIAVRTLWGSTADELVPHEGGQSYSDFAIAGLRIIEPTNNEVLLQPGYKSIKWHEAGAEYVNIGVSTNMGISWTKIYTVASPDPTNAWSIPIMGYPTGRLDVIVQDAGVRSNIFYTCTVEIKNQ